MAERSVGGAQDEVGAAAVVEGVVKQDGVEPALEVDRFHVGNLELGVDSLLLGELARDRDHLGGDVVAVSVEAVTGGEAGHPAGAAAELGQAHAGAQVEYLEDVAEVDQQARGHPRVVMERLVLEPRAAFFPDRDRVVDLGLLDAVGVCHGDR